MPLSSTATLDTLDTPELLDILTPLDTLPTTTVPTLTPMEPYLGKRSADAEPEADAALVYSNLGYTGYTGVAGYPYSLGYSAYNYGAYPYTYGARYLGKRSADAEPEADAALLYGNYGYTGYAGYAAPYGAYSYLG